ncbi:hypothetical protein [Microseira sp. BLCC-F43]|uniref:hypothetical protein n=1 Tax=Microseira sp. BLCC-F43 TaxID=3153602 RepID=UPI0035B6AE1F
MAADSILAQVVQNLEQHENLTRMKKLIYCACKKYWENDPEMLARLRLKDLLKELLDLSPTIEHLTVALNSVVKQLNKQAEYSLVANAIISELGKLYPNTEESTLVKSNRQHNTVSTRFLAAKQPTAMPPELQLNEPKRQYDTFDLRLEIMKYTNPLLAKIIVFSTVESKLFEFDNPQDWLAIKALELDELLLRLFRACETITELEFQLNSTAKCLEDPAQFRQIAGVIIRAMKPFYPYLTAS